MPVVPYRRYSLGSGQERGRNSRCLEDDLAEEVTEEVIAALVI